MQKTQRPWFYREIIKIDCRSSIFCGDIFQLDLGLRYVKKNVYVHTFFPQPEFDHDLELEGDSKIDKPINNK